MKPSIRTLKEATHDEQPQADLGLAGRGRARRDGGHERPCLRPRNEKFEAVPRSRRPGAGDSVSLWCCTRTPAWRRPRLPTRLAEVRAVDALMSLYRDDSQLVALNATAAAAARPAAAGSAALFADRPAQTGGAFDVTVQPLWDLSSQAPRRAAACRRRRDRGGARAWWTGATCRSRDDAVTLAPPRHGRHAQRHRAGLRRRPRAAGRAPPRRRARPVPRRRLSSRSAATSRAKALDARRPASAQPRRHRGQARASTAARWSTSGDYETFFTPDFLHHHIFDPATGDSPTAARQRLRAGAHRHAGRQPLDLLHGAGRGTRAGARRELAGRRRAADRQGRPALAHARPARARRLRVWGKISWRSSASSASPAHSWPRSAAFWRSCSPRQQQLYVYEDPRIEEVEACCPRAIAAPAASPAAAISPRTRRGQVAPAQLHRQQPRRRSRPSRGFSASRPARSTSASPASPAPAAATSPFYAPAMSASPPAARRRWSAAAARNAPGAASGSATASPSAIKARSRSTRTACRSSTRKNAPPATIAWSPAPRTCSRCKPAKQRLWVACSSRAEGDLAEAACEVACTACGKCVADAAAGLLTLREQSRRDRQSPGRPRPRARRSTAAPPAPSSGTTTRAARNAARGEEILRQDALPLKVS